MYLVFLWSTFISGIESKETSKVGVPGVLPKQTLVPCRRHYCIRQTLSCLDLASPSFTSAVVLELRVAAKRVNAFSSSQPILVAVRSRHLGLSLQTQQMMVMLGGMIAKTVVFRIPVLELTIHGAIMGPEASVTRH